MHGPRPEMHPPPKWQHIVCTFNILYCKKQIQIRNRKKIITVTFVSDEWGEKALGAPNVTRERLSSDVTASRLFPGQLSQRLMVFRRQQKSLWRRVPLVSHVLGSSRTEPALAGLSLPVHTRRRECRLRHTDSFNTATRTQNLRFRYRLAFEQF